MQRKLLVLPEKALVSRLWAEYNKLPEAYKKVLLNTAQSLALDAGRQEELKKGEIETVPFLGSH